MRTPARRLTLALAAVAAAVLAALLLLGSRDEPAPSGDHVRRAAAPGERALPVLDAAGRRDPDRARAAASREASVVGAGDADAEETAVEDSDVPAEPTPAEPTPAERGIAGWIEVVVRAPAEWGTAGGRAYALPAGSPGVRDESHAPCVRCALDDPTRIPVAAAGRYDVGFVCPLGHALALDVDVREGEVARAEITAPPTRRVARRSRRG